MKVLFVDVDGVLNCAAYLRATARGGIVGIDPYRVALLHRILEATGAKVVVSSSWRLNDENLAEVRVAVDPYYLDKTPHIWERDRRVDRGEEIAAWIADWNLHHPDERVEKYAILDDERDAGVGHGDNFFKTEWHGDGLNEEVVALVQAHLGVVN